jgi:NAD(P)-dependent dehydrogenase (short-subunit alcohol dehydrogenase family)
MEPLNSHSKYNEPGRNLKFHVPSPLLRHFYEDRRKQSADRHPLKRVGTPEDIANLAAFLLGEEGSWITGQVIGVDGGMGALKI